MLKILRHQVWGLEEAVVASGLPKKKSISLEDWDERIQDLKSFLNDELEIERSRYELLRLLTNPANVLRQGDRLSKELDRAKKLATCMPGTGHDSFLKGIGVTFLATFPAHWLLQFERYHFADIVSSQSTMHCLEQFDVAAILAETAVDPVIAQRLVVMLEELAESKEAVEKYRQSQRDEDGYIIGTEQYDALRAQYEDKWVQVMDSVPRGFTLTAYFTTNYLQLKSMYMQRRRHRLREWEVFCDWIETLPQWRIWFAEAG